jgi:hypothetical protein
MSFVAKNDSKVTYLIFRKKKINKTLRHDLLKNQLEDGIFEKKH